MNLRWLTPAWGIGLSYLLVSLDMQVAAQNVPDITKVYIDVDGRFTMEINGAAGEYIVETSTSDLEGAAWNSICRYNSSGTATQHTESINESDTTRFFRVVSVPVPDDKYLTSDYAGALDVSISSSDLEVIFGVTFGVGEDSIPVTSALPIASRNQRVYAAAIAALAYLAEQVKASSMASPAITVAEIVSAIDNDVADGVLNGLDSEANPIGIGSSGEFLPAYTAQYLLDAIDVVQTDISSLYNLQFVENGPGKVIPSIPAVWCTFYWDSADWQDLIVRV